MCTAVQMWLNVSDKWSTFHAGLQVGGLLQVGHCKRTTAGGEIVHVDYCRWEYYGLCGLLQVVQVGGLLQVGILQVGATAGGEVLEEHTFGRPLFGLLASLVKGVDALFLSSPPPLPFPPPVAFCLDVDIISQITITITKKQCAVQNTNTATRIAQAP